MKDASREPVVVGRLTDFPLGSQRVVSVGSLEVGMYNVDGTLHAIRNYCPHRGAPICDGSFGGTFLPSHPDDVQYGMEGRVVKCPWHHWQFDVTTGESLFSADRRRLVRYPVIVDGVEVRVVVPKAHIAEAVAPRQASSGDISPQRYEP